MHVPSIIGAVGVIVLAAALGCGPKKVPAEWADDCSTLKPQGDPVDTITVALFDSIDPSHAPRPENASERIVFNQLYPPLTAGTRSCPIPSAVAERWEQSDTAWVLTLKDNARFWDGTSVTAQDVAACLDIAGRSAAGFDSVFARDERTVDIVVDSASPVMLDSPSKAIVRRTNGHWPVGTGLYRVDPDESFDDGVILLLPNESVRPVIRFVDKRGTDPRSLMESPAGVDLLVLEDRLAIAYGYTFHKDFRHTEVDATRAYVLVSVTRAQAIEQGDQLPTLPGGMVHAISNEAVHQELTRRFDIRWLSTERCSVRRVGWAVALQPSRRVIYDAADDTARDLAERVAALAAIQDSSSSEALAMHRAIPDMGRAPIASVGVGRREFTVSLTKGSDFAYILPVLPHHAARCEMVDDLLNAAPWLGGIQSVTNKVLPLVEIKTIVFATRREHGFGFDLLPDQVGGILIVGTKEKWRQ